MKRLGSGLFPYSNFSDPVLTSREESDESILSKAILSTFDRGGDVLVVHVSWLGDLDVFQLILSVF